MPQDLEQDRLKAFICIFLSYLGDILRIDIIEAAHTQLGKNGKKYPVEFSRERKDKSPSNAK